MVKLKDSTHFSADGTFNIEKWLDHIAGIRSPKEMRLLRDATNLCNLAGANRAATHGNTYLQQGLIMAEILLDLNLDIETLCAALVFPSIESEEISLDDVTDHLGKNVTHLISAVSHLSSIGVWQKQQNIHIENIRKMLLALVQDVRAVFIKLAERLTLLRFSDKLAESA